MAAVFFALLPDAPSRLRLLRIQQALPQSGGWRLVAPQSMHLTLAFVGERRDDEIAVLIDAAGPITLVAMTQSTTGWLRLPAVERPQVLAVGVAFDAALRALTERVWRMLDQVGWKRPQRPLLPHVSLARRRGAAAPPMLDPPPIADLSWGHLGLYASSPTAAGPHYRALWSVASGQSSGQT